ncbi:ATP-dependent RNA helicase HrpA, partial [Actinotalea ferrariae]|uniref:ATP-dependent RNA helicase HrpA n=1 Tax=Actinotalea ferrariae TaxID=1386098 RepID=UPI001C8B6E4F
MSEEPERSAPDRPRSGSRRPRGRRGNRPDRPRDGSQDRGRDTGPRAVHDATRETERRARRTEARRDVVVPPITYPEQLPVSARREDIAAAIRDHQVVIVAGETGSGKTTQLPKIALELGRGREGQIGHTQPRRIAARSVAERISEEITGGAGALGSIVGYQVRFTDQSSEETLVKVMTDGILLAQIQRDPQLLAYDTLIIDEAHERSLNIDFILGYLTRLLPKRPDLKVVITSATIDSQRFARHFAGPPTPEHPEGVPAPVIEVSGRTYPVEVRYRPLRPDDPDDLRATGEDDDLDLPDAPLKRTPGRRTDVEERDLMTAICEAVDELCAEGPGDILVFLSGEREIRDAEDALAAHLGPRALGNASDGRGPQVPGSIELLPLYSRLSAAEQHRVFEPHQHRRVVLSTNVAETSLTVPGVRYVVDPGTARISRFSKATKVQRLPIEPISQASANQRSGRCGRVADGIAIRLYSPTDFASRPEFTEPEILRTSLASVILQMVAVGVASTPDDVAKFPFVEPPDVRAVRDGVQLLTELGALTPASEGTRLTDVGRALALLPMDPRLARMIVEGGRRDVAREVMIIAAALSIQDPRERPAEQRPQADQLHGRFADPTSDFLTYLNLWTYVRDQQRELSGSAFRRMCRAEHLNYLRLREWQDVVTQLREMAKPLGIVVRPPVRPAALPARTAPTTQQAKVDASLEQRRRSARGEAVVEAREPEEAPESLRLAWDGDRIHQALLSGLLSQVGMQEVTEVRANAPAKGRDGRPAGRRPQARNEYLGARGARFAIFPGSPLSRKPPAWIMAGELVETSRLWARDVARIAPEWAEELAPHLVKRTYSDPAWSTKQGAAMATERVLLYGVPIVAGRRVLFAKVDPEHARELFIRHALVQGEWTTHHAFFHDNRRLLAEAEQVEHRSRRRGLVVDDDALFAFYDERLPADVVSARHFDQWWKGARRRDPELLTYSMELLVGDAAVDEDAFPSVWPQADLRLPLTYQFEPGTESDGVTVHIPVTVLPRVRPEGFDWLVPGLHEELVVALVRALPKPIRVQLVPAPDVARAVVAWLRETQPSWEDTVRAADAAPSFTTVLGRAVRELRDVDVPDDAWDTSRLPAHLRMRFRVVEQRGRSTVELEEGSDLVALQRRLAARSEDAVRSAVRDAVRQAVRESTAPEGGARTPDDGTGRGVAGSTGPGQPGGASARGEARGPDSERGQSGARGPGGERRRDGDGPRGDQPVGGAAPQLERQALTTWPDDLPDGRLAEVVTTTSAGVTVHGYPALVAGDRRKDGRHPVGLRVLTTAGEQALRHPAGVRELLLGELALATGRVTSRWTTTESLTLAASPYPSTEVLVADLQRAAVEALAAEVPAAGTPAGPTAGAGGPAG